METITFDTHKFVKRLVSDGFTESFATKQDVEKVSIKLGNLENRLEKFATKQDVEKVATKLENCATKQDVEKVATKFKNCTTKQDLENFATKQDLNELRDDVRVAIAEVRRDTVALKDRLSIFMWVVSFAQVGVFVVLGWIVFTLMGMG